MIQRSLRMESPRLIVAIPARNEAEHIGETLAGFAAQCDAAGRALPRGLFAVLVFANNCDDATADVARRIARTSPCSIDVVERRTDRAAAHVGFARKYALDAAAATFARAAMPEGIIASIDADTTPAPTWVDRTLYEMNARDAVAGHVTIARDDRAKLLGPVRLLYARELAYRRLLAEVEALIDPVPGDPLPRHGSFVGASFAVTARAYAVAGGIPSVPRLEDVAFARALQRIDARIRYSPLVRATTSARLDAKVDGGFGTFLAGLHDCARRGTSFTVEDPARSLADFELRAALRRVRRGHERAGDLDRIERRLAPTDRIASLDFNRPLGAIYQDLVERPRPRLQNEVPALVETAIARLADARTALLTSPHRHRASDSRAIRDVG